MAFSYRRALVAAGVAATASVGPLSAQYAQGGQSPNLTVSGLVYTQFVYQLKDTANHVNNFDITRAYINLLGKFSGGVGTRVTGDIYRNADGSLGYRLKYAYATYTPEGSPLTFKLGQIHTPWLDWEEALWDYRVQGQMAMERNGIAGPGSGYLSSSDFGAGIDGKWGADKVNFQLTVVNGENYNKTPGDQRKDLMGRASVRLLDTDDSSRVGGLRLTAYGQYGKPTGGGQRQRWLAMVSYRSKQFTLAAEAATTKDSVTAPLTRPINGHVYSAFGVAKLPNTKWAFLARVDVTLPQTGDTTAKHTRIIGGVSYQLSPNWRLLLDWDYLNFQTDALNTANDPTRSQALFQSQFTF
ncbi:MAG TPA: porin [Gemmatimonadales bacterium]|nr:porin [Gemmatimonadales bacterium]